MMRVPVFLLLALFGASPGVGAKRGADPAALYTASYKRLREAKSRLYKGEIRAAKGGFREVKKGLERLLSVKPPWNREAVRKLMREAEEGERLAREREPVYREAEALLKKGKKLMEKGEHREALPLLGRAARGNPRSASALRALALCQISLGQASPAVENLERAKTLAPGDPSIRLALGRSLLETGEAERAVVELDRALAMGAGGGARKDLSRAVLTRSSELVEAGRMEQALDLLERGRERCRGREIEEALASLKRFRAFSDPSAGGHEKGGGAIESLYDESPFDPAVLRGMARTAFESGKYAKALFYMEEADRVRPGTVDKEMKLDASLLLSEELLSDGRPEEALYLLKGARGDFPGSSRLSLALMRAQLALGNLEAAQRHVGEAEGATAEGDMAAADLDLARALVKAGRHDESFSLLEKAGELDPSIEVEPLKLDFLLASAESSASAGDFAEAEGFFRKAGEILPEDGRVLRGLGDVLFKMDRLEEAEETFRRTLQTDPRDASTRKRLCVTLYRLEKYPEALQALTEVPALDADDPEVHLYLGLTYRKMESLGLALKAWRRAEGLYPEGSEARRKISLLIDNVLSLLNKRGGV